MLGRNHFSCPAGSTWDPTAMNECPASLPHCTWSYHGTACMAIQQCSRPSSLSTGLCLPLLLVAGPCDHSQGTMTGKMGWDAAIPPIASQLCSQKPWSHVLVPEGCRAITSSCTSYPEALSLA